MDRKKYFRDLITLLEEEGMAGTDEVVAQENIADTGSDVNPGMEGNVEEQPVNGDETDFSGMEGEIPQSTAASMNNIMLSQKLLKLLGLYEDLLGYCTVFLDSLGNIDTNLLDLETFKLVRKYTVSTKELADKINNYMINIYADEDYERVLYTYVLFRTELTTCIRGIRDILKLNNPYEKFENNEKK